MKIEGSKRIRHRAAAPGLGRSHCARARGARRARGRCYDLPRSRAPELEKELVPRARASCRRRHRRATGERRARRCDRRGSGPLRGLVQAARASAARRARWARTPSVSLDGFRRTIEVNLIGTFNVIRLAAARMVGKAPDAGGERGRSRTRRRSRHSRGRIGQAAYSARKGGVVGMTLPIAPISRATDPRVHDRADCSDAAARRLPAPALEALGKSIPFPSAARRAGRVTRCSLPHSRTRC